MRIGRGKGVREMTYNEVFASLPRDAKWSSCFGYPGGGGYVEYHRDSRGVRYVVSNGDWMAFEPFDWSVTRLEPMPAPSS